MIERRPCPLCDHGYVTANLGWGKVILGRCLPCAGTGRIQIIARDEYELLADWLTPSQVMAMKARGELSTNARVEV